MAKFKKGDEVEYKGRHYLVHRVNGEEAEISDWVGHDLTVGVNDPALKLIAHNSRATNAKFKVGDRVKSVRTGRKGTLLSMVRGRDVLADRLGALWNVKFDDGAEGMLREGTELTLANSVCSRNSVVAKAINAQRAARNAAGDFVQYYADSYSYIPKVGEIYKYDGKRVKCTSVQRLQRGSDDRDRYLIEGRVVG